MGLTLTDEQIIMLRFITREISPSLYAGMQMASQRPKGSEGRGLARGTRAA